MMEVLNIITALSYMCLIGFLINGLSGCQVEMYYLKTKLNQSSANTRCIEMGYQGLVELKTQQQQKHANDLMYFNNKDKPAANVWIGLTYNMSMESNSSNIWISGEPNELHNQRCVRLMYNSSKQVVGWASKLCWKLREALCQWTKDLSSNYMELLYSDTAAPVGSTAFRVRSLMDCVTLCILDCSCQAIHYSGDECRLMTYYLLDSISTTPTDIMGIIYAKTFNEQPETIFSRLQ